MLLGQYEQNIDAKGRVNVPAKFREDLGESFVVSRGLDDTVAIYSKSGWETFVATLESAPLTQSRALKRYFFGYSYECEMDSQGRFVIPPNLREIAGLKKEITVVGVQSHVEIWSRDNWEGYSDAPAFNADEIAKLMENLGI